MSHKKYKVTCPCCSEQVKNVQIGSNSYAELECPHCKSLFWVKSTGTGIKANLLNLNPTHQSYVDNRTSL